MYKRIKNLQELETFLCSAKGMELFGEDNKNVKSEMFTLVEILDTSYGSNRDIDADLGGWLGIIMHTAKDIENELKEQLGAYPIPPYEFENTYIDTSDPKFHWKIRLYILSSDYSIIVVYRTDDKEVH